MKLYKILNHIDFMQLVRIKTANPLLKDNSDTLFIGFSSDVPWNLAKLKLDTDENNEAIYAIEDKNSKEEEVIYLDIYVK